VPWASQRRARDDTTSTPRSGATTGLCRNGRALCLRSSLHPSRAADLWAAQRGEQLARPAGRWQTDYCRQQTVRSPADRQQTADSGQRAARQSATSRSPRWPFRRLIGAQRVTGRRAPGGSCDTLVVSHRDAALGKGAEPAAPLWCAAPAQCYCARGETAVVARAKSRQRSAPDPAMVAPPRRLRSWRSRGAQPRPSPAPPYMQAHSLG
jgi:hypothetical protein